MRSSKKTTKDTRSSRRRNDTHATITEASNEQVSAPSETVGSAPNHIVHKRQEAKAESKEESTKREDLSNGDTDTKQTAKRKKPASSDTQRKAPRRSARSTAKATVEPMKLLNVLLSPDALPLTRPRQESEALAANPDLRCYTSTAPLSPFEELLCALIFSRPISHALGQRSIRTVLNAPYSFTTPKAIRRAGEEKRHQSLWDARTQHKAKTAGQIGALAEVAAEKFAAEEDDSDMRKLRQQVDGDREKLREVLVREVKGMGRTGTDIFLRRVQGVWKEIGPFVDERTKASLERLGLPGDAEVLKRMVEEWWDEADVRGIKDAGFAFVTVLERVVGTELEGRIDEILEMVGKS